MWLQKQQLMSAQSKTNERSRDVSRDPTGVRHPIAVDKTRDVTLQQHNSSILPRLLNFFSLAQQPFGVTPDPSFLYLSQTHREALASLVYGIETGRGFLALVAKPGMGKTTLLFHLLEKFRNSARSAFLFQTQCTSREFLQFLFEDLGLETDSNQDFVRMHQELNRHLMQEARAGKRFIILIDEAHNLDSSVLETVRLLSNFETRSAKLLQIILSGQPELGNKLASRDMVQLKQRIGSLNRLEPFSAAETERYIQHRLQISGYKGSSLITSDAVTIIADFSNGIPRNINNFCFNALSLAFALQQKTIDANVAREVINDLDVSPHSRANDVANQEVPNPLAKSCSSTANHDRQGEAISDLGISPPPFDGNHNPNKEVAPTSEPRHRRHEQVISATEPSVMQLTAKGTKEVVGDLDTLRHPVEPQYGLDEKLSSALELSRSLLQLKNNGKNEVASALDTFTTSSEPNQPLKEQGKGFASPKWNDVQTASPDAFARLSGTTEERSMPLAEAREYMKTFIRFLRSDDRDSQK